MMQTQSQNAVTKFETVYFMKRLEWQCGHGFYYVKFQGDCLEGALSVLLVTLHFVRHLECYNEEEREDWLGW
jgi:hypothetical protein